MTVTDTYVDLTGVECKRLAALVRANGGWPKGLEGHGALIESLGDGEEVRIVVGDLPSSDLFAELAALVSSGGI